MQQLALRSKLQAESIIHMKVWDCQLHSATRVDWCQQKRPWGGEKYERGRGTLSVCHYTVMIDIIRLWYVWIGAHLVKKLFRFLRQCTILTGHSRKVKVVRAEPHLAAHGHTLHYSQRTHFCQPFPANLSTSRKKRKGSLRLQAPLVVSPPCRSLTVFPVNLFWNCWAELFFSSAKFSLVEKLSSHPVRSLFIVSQIQSLRLTLVMLLNTFRSGRPHRNTAFLKIISSSY